MFVVYKMCIFWTLWWYLWCKVHIAVSGSWYVLGRGIQNYAPINTLCINWNEIVSNCRYMMLLQLGRIMYYKKCASAEGPWLNVVWYKGNVYSFSMHTFARITGMWTVRFCYVQTVVLQDCAIIWIIWVLNCSVTFLCRQATVKADENCFLDNLKVYGWVM
jgi:hypothetical protein